MCFFLLLCFLLPQLMVGKNQMSMARKKYYARLNEFIYSLIKRVNIFIISWKRQDNVKKTVSHIDYIMNFKSVLFGY